MEELLKKILGRYISKDILNNMIDKYIDKIKTYNNEFKAETKKAMTESLGRMIDECTKGEILGDILTVGICIKISLTDNKMILGMESTDIDGLMVLRDQQTGKTDYTNKLKSDISRALSKAMEEVGKTLDERLSGGGVLTNVLSVVLSIVWG